MVAQTWPMAAAGVTEAGADNKLGSAAWTSLAEIVAGRSIGRRLHWRAPKLVLCLIDDFRHKGTPLSELERTQITNNKPLEIMHLLRLTADDLRLAKQELRDPPRKFTFCTTVWRPTNSADGSPR